MKVEPIIVDSYRSKGRKLLRCEVQSNEDKNESWLQQLIYQHPELLPAGEFDESFQPLIPLGREIRANRAGNIDNLYISPKGKLTIVETKLWKNPEMHRKVVAQIIDYAKEVSSWTYDQLNEAVKRAIKASAPLKDDILVDRVKPFLDEQGLSTEDFQENTIASLCSGEFLLLIVGDKISPNVALLTEAIQGVPGLDFRLGLVELQLYKTQPPDDWPLIVVPDIVGRTVETIRGVIKVQYEQKKPEVTVDVAESPKSTAAKGKTTPEVFLKSVNHTLKEVYEDWLKKWDASELVLYWGTTGFSLRTEVEGKLQTVMEAYPNWAVALVRKKDKERLGLSENDYDAYVTAVSTVPHAKTTLREGKKYLKHEELEAHQLMTVLKATDELASACTSQAPDAST